MKKYITSAMLFAASLAPVTVCAQSVSVDFDQKVIYTDSLNLTPNSKVVTALSMIPEQLQRPGDFILSNYDIQVNGMSVGTNADIVLQQISLVDVEKIKISESPISSYKNNGQGGSIDIVLRSVSKDGNNTWGSAGLFSSYPTDFAPQFNIGHHNGKFKIHGLLLGEFYKNTSDVDEITYRNNQVDNWSQTVSDSRFSSEMARAYMTFTPTAKDEVCFDVSEIYTHTKKLMTEANAMLPTSENKENSTNLESKLKYKHSFSKSEFTVQAEYSFRPGNSDFEKVNEITNANDFHSHQLAGKVEYKATLFNHANAGKNGVCKGDLTVGTNFNMVLKDENISQVRYAENGIRSLDIAPENNTYYAMPYANFEGTFGKMRLKVVGEWQRFKYDIMRDELPFSKVSNDITGKIIGEWHITPMQELRLILARNLQRPSDEQLYPYHMYSPLNDYYVLGNPELNPMKSHEITLDYFTTSKWDGGNTLTFNIAGNFNRVNDILTSTTSVNADKISYTTFENAGSSNIIGANLMALYSHKAFSMSVTGNVFHNMLDNDHYTYYNLSVYPHFILKDGWHGGARLTYYSKVAQKNKTLSDATYAMIQVGKSWSHFSVYVYENLALKKHAKDRTNLSDYLLIERQYEMTPSSAGICLNYRF